MTMPGGHGNWATLRSYTRDQAVAQQKLAPGTLKRIALFARPYRRWLVIFLLLILVDAVLGAANPLIYKEIIDKGILPKDVGVVTWLAVLVAVIALVDAVVSLAMRWYSARIGEGLIYDMRARVFAHIQRMPIAFFTRTQTGALISRLNNDVLGAQQAFTGTLSTVVSNVISVIIVLIAMMVLSWQITLISLVLLPVFIVPARLMGRRLQKITRESYNLNAEMSVSRLDRLNLSNVRSVYLGSGLYRISYHVKLPVAWGHKDNLPSSYTLTLPRRVGAGGRPDRQKPARAPRGRPDRRALEARRPPRPGPGGRRAGGQE